jgi:hypothetical protein
MRMTLGLDRPTAGSVTVNGKPFAAVYSAMREVGALLDAKAVHGGRSAYHHLLCLAQTNAIPRSRVDEVIGVVGLEDVAGKRSKGFSLGMSQRLGIAAALLGAPEVLMFDEPVNGKLIADCPMAEFTADRSAQAATVKTPDDQRLATVVTAAGGRLERGEAGELTVYWTLLAQVLASIGWAVLDCAGTVSHGHGPDFNAAEASLTGQVALGELIIVVLGALVITSEYSTGMIRTSLAVMPRRGVLYAAKAIVFAAVTSTLALITSFTSFFIGQAILSGKHYNTTLTQPGVLRRAALGGDRHGVRAARLRHRRAHPAHRRGDHRDPRGDLPDPGAGRGPAEQLVRGRDPVAARRRGAQPHCQVRAAALPAPVQRLG